MKKCSLQPMCDRLLPSLSKVCAGVKKKLHTFTNVTWVMVCSSMKLFYSSVRGFRFQLNARSSQWNRRLHFASRFRVVSMGEQHMLLSAESWVSYYFLDKTLVGDKRLYAFIVVLQKGRVTNYFCPQSYVALQHYHYNCRVTSTSTVVYCMTSSRFQRNKVDTT